jgi:hypothetical protein
VADCGNIPRIDVWERPQESESRQGVVHFPVFQQLELQRVARLLPVGGRFAVHQVYGVSALVRGKPDAASEQVQKYVAMVSEERTKFFGILFVRPEPFQVFGGTATTVIQQDAGDGPRPWGRQSIACRVADPLWMTTVSGPSDFWPKAVPSVSVRTSSARTNAHSFVI